MFSYFSKDIIFSFYFLLFSEISEISEVSTFTWQIYPLICHGSGKLLSSGSILKDHFLSNINRFPISINWKCFVKIFIETTYNKFPNIERLDTCKPLQGSWVYSQSHTIGPREQGCHFSSPLLLPFLFWFTSFTVSAPQFSTLLVLENCKKPANSTDFN